MRILALDVGDRRIGLAISDPTGMLASPLGHVERGDADVAETLRVAAENDAEEIVVGIPLTMSGASGEQAGKTRAFVRSLRNATAIPVRAVDERLSTAQAERLLRDAGRGRRRRRGGRGRVDASAAAVILQAHLDARRFARG